jgi:hypothetical protein
MYNTNTYIRKHKITATSPLWCGRTGLVTWTHGQKLAYGAILSTVVKNILQLSHYTDLPEHREYFDCNLKLQPNRFGLRSININVDTQEI